MDAAPRGRGAGGRWGGGARLLARLSTPPEGRWPDGFLHHGARVAILLGVALATTLFFPPAPGVQVARFEVGTASSEDVIARIAFDVPKNRDDLERERLGAAASVPPTVITDPGAVDRMEQAIERFFLDAVQAAGATNPEARLSALLSERGMVASTERVERLADAETREVIRESALSAVRELLPRGVLDDAERLAASVGRILVVEADGTERYVLRDSIRTSREFFEGAMERIPSNGRTGVDDLVRLTLIHFFAPSLRFDAEATERDRDAARRAVPTIRTSVLEGEAIVRTGQRITEDEVDRLRAYEEALRAQGGFEELGPRFLPFVGGFALNLLLLGIFGGYLFLFRPEVYGEFRWVLLLGGLATTFTGAGGLVAYQSLPAELLPIAFVALASAVLWDGRLALVLAVVLAAVAGVQAPFQPTAAWLPVLAGGAAAALSVRAVRRRAQTWIFIAIIAAAYLLAIVGLGLLSGRDPTRILVAVGWATGNTVVSAILAMGFLPVFEWFTRITTDQTLLEWADPNRPLLKRLSLEAPGTYAHTINVVNLSEAAANAIGANGLLCRVGVYYHDVGKMLKPQYFIENQPGGRNPHDKLKPATSASIVREHVTEGMRLAREANLPEVLLAFIPEHHGTQEIAYFLDKARRELGEDEELDLEVFRYPGPRPQSRETAIVMLADSVESATRTVQDPTPERIQALIHTIVEGKIQAGQLDEAPLTLQDIPTIKEAFLKVLSGLYHQRIDYPQTRHITGARGPVSEAERTPERPPPAPAEAAVTVGAAVRPGVRPPSAAAEGPAAPRTSSTEGPPSSPRRGQATATERHPPEPTLFPLEGLEPGPVGDAPVDPEDDRAGAEDGAGKGAPEAGGGSTGGTPAAPSARSPGHGSGT